VGFLPVLDALLVAQPTVSNHQTECQNYKERWPPYPSLQVNGKPVWNKYPLRPPFDFFLIVTLLKVFHLGSLNKYIDPLYCQAEIMLDTSHAAPWRVGGEYVDGTDRWMNTRQLHYTIHYECGHCWPSIYSTCCTDSINIWIRNYYQLLSWSR